MSMGAKLLVIEDNRVNLELMQYALQSFGYQTLTAADGASGLALARRELPDLILCDVQMPGVDGFAVVRAAKDDPQLRGIPMLAVTAYAMVGDRERLIAAGFDGYIAKPIDPLTLAESINAFLPAALQPRSDSVQPGARPASAPEQVAKATTILVLDDSPVNLLLKRALLEPHGYTVLTASSMASALALARSTLPDLIISDVGMPEGDGFEVIQAVKGDPRLRDVPFIFVSATYWDAASRERGLSLGAVRYLTRPMEPQLLLAEIRACLKR